MAGKILVGTASWADPDFIRDWYPKGMGKHELLPWYATHFNLVEVNSTFYTIPETKTVAHWVEQTPDGFVFDIKAHKALSRHSATFAELPPDLRRLAEADGEKARLTPELELALLDRLQESIAPLVAADRLGAVLLQLSPSISPKFHNIDELAAIIEALGPYGLAVELRNRNWMTSEKAPEVTRYFEKQGVTLVTVDAPDSEHFMVMPKSDIVTNPALAYMRLHGRDEKVFTKGKTVSKRFNYEYSPAEIQQTVDTVRRLAEHADDVHIIYNNNHSNLAPKAAEHFLRLIE